MGIGSSGVVNCANTYLGTANYTVADGYVADRTVIVDGNGPAQLNLNFARDEVLDPRVTFSRTSNATRVNAQGLIEYAPHNLLTNSENFDNAAWSKSGGEVVGANLITAPDGNTTADKLMVGSSVFAQTVQTQATTVSNIHTASIYLCENEIRYVQIRLRNSVAQSNYVRTLIDLNTGALYLTGSSGNGSGAVASAVKVGNFWRLSLSGTADTTGTLLSLVVILCKDTAGTAAGTANSLATDGAYLWGAQLNIGPLQPYYTTSVKNLLGYAQNFENAAWTKSNSSVLTNLLTYSQEFDNAAWMKSNATVTANAVVAPDGTLTADILNDTSNVSAGYVYQSAAMVAGSVYAWSVYAKSNDRPDINFTSFTQAGSITFTLSGNGSYTTPTGVITSAVITNIGGGWYRCAAIITANATGNNNIGYSTNQSGYVGAAFAFWGAQLVQGTNPEEYTVTTSAAAPIQVMGPLGFLGAEKLVEDTATSSHRLRQIIAVNTGTPMTISIYAKAGERNSFDLFDAYTSKGAYFNLANGTVTTPQSSGLTFASNATINNLGYGWYRCSVTTTTNTTSISLSLLISDGSTTTYTGDGTSGIYIFGAQLSDSASLDPYSYNFGAAPTSSAYYGPRFDYDPVTLAPKGLLIEEQRVNSIRNNTMQGAVVGTPGTLPTNYTYTGGGLAANVVGIGYEGGINYVDIQFVGTATSGSSGLRFEGNAGVGASTGQTWNTSLYVRKISGTTSGISTVGTSLTYLIAGAGSDAIAKVIPFDTLDLTSIAYNRQDVTLTAVTLGITAVRPQLLFGHTIGANVNITLRIGMPQLEQGAFPTSVIPTTTTQVTRTADNASMVGTNFSSWYNQNEGTVTAEVDYSSISTYSTVFDINDGTSANRTRTIGWNDGTERTLNVNVNNVDQVNFSNTNTIGSQKYAVCYKLNDFAAAKQGNITNTDTSGLIPYVNQMQFGSYSLTQFYLNGHIQSFKYFSKRLLNSYLQSLTQ